MNPPTKITIYFRLSTLSTYYIPRDGTLQSYRDYIQLLPNVDRPEAFGQHPNADIASLITDTRSLFETLLSLQVQSSSGGGESHEDKVYQLAMDIESKVPQPINYEETSKLIGPNKQPLDVVLLQEIERYNVLLVRMLDGLADLQKGIKGLVVMTSELEDIFNSMYDGRVPQVWLNGMWFFVLFVTIYKQDLSIHSIQFFKTIGIMGTRFGIAN